MTRSGVLCAGSIVVDLGKIIDAYPERDHLAMIEQVQTSTGGPGLNMAINLRQLGATFPIGMLGAVGEDEHGAFILAQCRRLDIDVQGIEIATGAVTSFTDAMVEKHGGRRTFFHHPGANADFDGSTAPLETSAARILHAGAPGLHRLMDGPADDGANGWCSLLRRARAAGMHTNLELIDLPTDRQLQLVHPCLPHLDSIVINELEAAALTDLQVVAADPDAPVDWAGLEGAAVRLLELGVSTLAVVHFPAGCVAAAADGRTWRQGSVRLSGAQVRSTTGAGDAFAAGVILGMHERWPVEDCLRLAVASAAQCIRSPHTSDGIQLAAVCLAEAERAGYRSTIGGRPA